MKLLALVIGLAAAACGAPSGGDDQGDDGVGDDQGDEATARAVVQLVEQRIDSPAFRNGSAQVQIAPFDGRTYPVCGEQVVFEGGDCRITRYQAPTCDSACAADEFCFVDAKNGCEETCRAVCQLPCAEGMYCLPGDTTCRPIEAFDGAGDITVDGLTEPLTLAAPNYPFTIFDDGAVYSGGEVRVTADGATAVGIDAFELALSPPPDVVATPPLSSLTEADLAGDLALTWPAAGDEMELAFFVGNFETSWNASALCRTADDGAFTIPGALFAEFPADTSVVRIDSRRVREASTETSASGFYLGSAIPPRAEAVLRLIRLETWTISF